MSEKNIEGQMMIVVYFVIFAVFALFSVTTFYQVKKSLDEKKEYELLFLESMRIESEWCDEPGIINTSKINASVLSEGTLVEIYYINGTLFGRYNRSYSGGGKRLRYPVRIGDDEGYMVLEKESLQ